MVALIDERVCDALANDILNDPNIPSWTKRNAEWYKGGSIDCQTFFNANSFLANEDIIEGELQQAIQLVELGRQTSRRSEEIQQVNTRLQDELDILNSQRIADNKALEEINERLSRQSVELGQAISDLSSSQQFGGITSGLAGFGLGSGTVLILLAFLFLRSKK